MSDDCEQRISESQFEAEDGVSMALGKLMGITDPAAKLVHCNCNAANSCLNMSVACRILLLESATLLASKNLP